jgi:Amino acid permease
MGEEVRNSAITVPRIVILTIVINGVMAFGFLLVILFCIGDVEKALNTPTGFPIIEIFYQATGSKTAATLMETCIIIIAFAASFGNMASVSRLTWAFARDGGLFFSDFFSFVSPSLQRKLYHHNIISYRSIPPTVSPCVQSALSLPSSSSSPSSTSALPPPSTPSSPSQPSPSTSPTSYPSSASS